MSVRRWLGIKEVAESYHGVVVDVYEAGFGGEQRGEGPAVSNSLGVTRALHGMSR